MNERDSLPVQNDTSPMEQATSETTAVPFKTSATYRNTKSSSNSLLNLKIPSVGTPKQPVHISSSDADESESAEEDTESEDGETTPMIQLEPTKQEETMSPSKQHRKKPVKQSEDEIESEQDKKKSTIWNRLFQEEKYDDNAIPEEATIENQEIQSQRAMKNGPKWWWFDLFNKNQNTLKHRGRIPGDDVLSSYHSENSMLPSDSLKKNSLQKLSQQKELLEDRVRTINAMMSRMKETKRSMKQKSNATTPTSAPRSEQNLLEGMDYEGEYVENNSLMNVSQPNKKLRKKKTSGSMDKLGQEQKRKKSTSEAPSANIDNVEESPMLIIESSSEPIENNYTSINGEPFTIPSPQHKINVFDNYFTKSFSAKSEALSPGKEKLPSDSIFDKKKEEEEEGRSSAYLSDNNVNNPPNIVGTSYSTLFEYERQVQLILIDLGFALATYGIPAHRLEYHLTYISKQFGIKPCQLEYTSTGLLFSFSDPIDWLHYNVNDTRSTSTTLYINIDSANLSSAGGSLNLDKLYKLDQIAEGLAERRITIQEARSKIRSVMKSRPIFNHFLYQIVTHLLSSFAWVVFLDGSILEMITSCVVGVMVGLFCTLADRYPYFNRVNSVINSVVAGLIATILKIIFAQFADPVSKPLSVFLVTLCGIFGILPGIQFTTGIAELSTRHLLSGSVRLFSGFVVTLQLGFGVLMATGIDQFLSNNTNIFAHDRPEKYRKFSKVPEWVLALVLPLIIVSNIFTFRVPKKIVTYIFVFVISYIAFFVTVFSSYYLGTEVGALLGALVCGLIGNIYAHISRNPGLLITVCGTVLLIPAAFGVRGVKEFLAANSGNETSLISGIEFVFNLLSITVSVTIVVGRLYQFL